MATSSLSLSTRAVSKSTVLPADRTDPAKKTEIIKELSQISLRIKNLEKEKLAQLYNRRSNFRDLFVVFEDADQSYTEARKAELMRLHQQVNKVKTMVYKFKRELIEIKPTPEFVERLKVIMEDIEENISQLKEQHRIKYDELLREEKTLNQEILALEKRFDSFVVTDTVVTGAVSTGVLKAPLKSARDVNKCLPPQVAAFNTFLQQTGGLCGGWDEYDHGTFLKVRSKHKGKGTFLREVIPLLPTKDKDQVYEHERWFQEYLRMVELKKEVIQRWKEEKEVEKDEKLVEMEKNVQKESKLAKEREQQTLIKIEAEKKEQYQRLEAWKEEKDKQIKFDESRKNREEKKKVAEEAAWRRKQEELRAQVSAYKEQLADKRESELARQIALQAEKDEERRRVQAQRSEQIKDRSQQHLEARKAKLVAKNRSELEKQQRLERFKKQTRIQVESDPSRLLKPTEVWKERQKADDTGQGRVYQMPHRAVPNWRQNIH